MQKRQILLKELAAFASRDEATRTPDPYVPNVVRYQLRYIPIACKALSQLANKVPAGSFIALRYCGAKIL